MKQRSSTDEFKRETVRLATSGEKSTAQTARDLGISADTLYTWVRLFGPAKDGEREPLSPDERSGGSELNLNDSFDKSSYWCSRIPPL